MEQDFDVRFKKCLIEMMAWLHEFCVKNNIRYFALGGTMLGAARHHGFIPWDDDIDIGIPRSDYERLALLLENTSGRYRLETPNSSNDDFLYTYSKLYDTSTTLIENSKIPVRRGVFIDIFPLDGIGNTLQESQDNYKVVDRKRMLLVSRVTAIRKGRSFAKNLAVIAAQIVPSFILNNKKLQREIDTLCKKYNYDKCVYGGNLLGHWRYKEVMASKIMGNPTLYKFENIEIFGAENYDDYLTKLYGNWKQLPPVEQRVTIHDFECDLDKSYLDNRG